MRRHHVYRYSTWNIYTCLRAFNYPTWILQETLLIFLWIYSLPLSSRESHRKVIQNLFFILSQQSCLITICDTIWTKLLIPWNDSFTNKQSRITYYAFFLIHQCLDNVLKPYFQWGRHLSRIVFDADIYTRTVCDQYNYLTKNIEVLIIIMERFSLINLLTTDSADIYSIYQTCTPCTIYKIN